jgi:serine/threonine protein kinase/Tfp pilus assembly protein PilF
MTHRRANASRGQSTEPAANRNDAPSATTPGLGARISHYRLEAELGRGGMGVVYRARDERLARDVALKLLLDVESDRDQRDRILAEARAAAALNHPGIVTIYEVGEDGARLFISMELVAGQTLRELSAAAPLATHELARLGAQIAEALAAAHARGIIHGDVKPENVVVQANGRVKLLDFGIASIFAAKTLATTRSTMTETPKASAQIAGTLAYMAPEQLRGAPADHRADIFSFGVVCYELAVGQRPFVGNRVTALLHQVLHENPVLPTDSSRVPPQLARIIGRLLEKDPNSRYQSANDVQIDLTNLARDLELGPAPPRSVVGKRAVAVLPFKLLTRNTDDEYLSIALADTLINHLSTGELLVRPTAMIQRYAREAIEPLRAARELNVAVVIDGSIQKLGSKVRVHVQALNAHDGSLMLTSKHDGEMADLFDLQDAIGEALSTALAIDNATKTKAEDRPTKNKTAYELLLRAADKLSRLNRWDTRAAIDMLETAVDLDPRFAAAWARIAEAYLLMAFTFGEGLRAVAAAERAARRALALDPSNSIAQCSHALVLWSPARGFQNRAALRALAIALKLNPGNLTALQWQCLIFLHVGLFDAAREGLRTVLAVRPDDPTTLFFLGQLAYYRHNYPEADEYHARALAIDATHIWATVFYPVISLYRGAVDNAEQKIALARDVLPNDPWLQSCEALLWAKRGEPRKAARMLSLALSGKKPLFHTHHMWHTGAAAYALMGEGARAISLLERAAAFGLPNYTLFRDDPHFRGLHGVPRFKKLMARLKRDHRAYVTDFDSHSP